MDMIFDNHILAGQAHLFLINPNISR